MIDLLEAVEHGRESQNAQQPRRPYLKILVGIVSLACLVAALAFKFTPAPSTTKTVRFFGTVDFADKRKESREMIEFTFLSDSKIAYLEKKRVEWSGSAFEVLVEIPKQESTTAFSAVLDHPGYKRFEIEPVQMIGDEVNLPTVSLIRKWRSKKRRRKRKRELAAPRESAVTPSNGEQERTEAMKRSLQELERNSQGH